MEIWDIVNERGEPLGYTWERADHDNMPLGVYHPCVEIWVRVGDRLLITRRHPDKSEGLCYDLPGGAVLSGEDIFDGALRELFEEVGITARPDELVEIGRLATGKVYAVSYLLRLNVLPEIALQPTEVVGYKLVTRDELLALSPELTRGTRNRFSIYDKIIFN